MAIHEADNLLKFSFLYSHIEKTQKKAILGE